MVLDRIRQKAKIYDAWANEPWTVEGANVRVSLICFARAEIVGSTRLNGLPAAEIWSDLTAVADLDLTTAATLAENRGIIFMGDTKGGAFYISGETARKWLDLPLNVNGRPNADVLRPWANGKDIMQRPSDTWIIDFGGTMGEADAAYYAAPFGHVISAVKPVRKTNSRDAYRRYWWRHVEPRPGMWQALARLQRCIVTPEVSKHRVFAWLSTMVVPDHKLQVVARGDEVAFGILHSHVHRIWALQMGSRHGDGDDGGRLRYTNTKCFDTFPFPEHLTPNLPATSYATNPHAQAIAAAARELVEKRDAWLNPPDLVERIPEVVPGFPDRILPRNEKAAAILKTRTLTNLYNMRGTPEGAWLDNLHRALDEAVAAAYGWPTDLADEDVLSRLLELNRARAGSGTKDPADARDSQSEAEPEPA